MSKYETMPEGKIEIYTGSVWIYVDENLSDESLCEKYFVDGLQDYCGWTRERFISQVQLARNTKAQYFADKQSKADKRALQMEEARKTGKPVLLSRRVVEVDNGDDEDGLLTVEKFLMPDGSISEKNSENY